MTQPSPHHRNGRHAPRLGIAGSETRGGFRNGEYCGKVRPSSPALTSHLAAASEIGWNGRQEGARQRRAEWLLNGGGLFRLPSTTRIRARAD